jgi:hypothetical protein
MGATNCSVRNHQQWDKLSVMESTISGRNHQQGSNHQQWEQPSAVGATISSRSNHQQWEQQPDWKYPSAAVQPYNTLGQTCDDEYIRKFSCFTTQIQYQRNKVLRDKLIEFLFFLSFGKVVIP